MQETSEWRQSFQYITAKMNLLSCNSKEHIIIVTTLWVLLSLSDKSNSVVCQGGRQSVSKRERKWSTTPPAPLGASWVSYKPARLLKPINGMAQSAPVCHCSATLFITSRTIRWIASFSTLNGCKQRFGEGWMISTCCDFCVLCRCLQAEPPLNSIGG